MPDLPWPIWIVIVWIALAVVFVLVSKPEPLPCSRCGGDMVRWTDRRDIGIPIGAYTVLRTYEFEHEGCPKVRDRGAGSPDDEWQRHDVRIVKARRIREQGRIPHG